MQALDLPRSALMVTTAIIHMRVLPMDITGRAILSAACSSARAPGITATTGAAIATMDALATATTAQAMATDPAMVTGRDMAMAIAQGMRIVAFRRTAMLAAAITVVTQAVACMATVPAVTTVVVVITVVAAASTAVGEATVAVTVK